MPGCLGNPELRGIRIVEHLQPPEGINVRGVPANAVKTAGRYPSHFAAVYSIQVPGRLPQSRGCIKHKTTQPCKNLELVAGALYKAAAFPPDVGLVVAGGTEHN